MIWTHPGLEALSKIPAAVRARWNVDTTYARTLRVKYGLTPEQYMEILWFQEGRCAICRRWPRSRRLNVDHRHSDGLVRGLICWDCNKELAWHKDDIASFERAIDYLTHAVSIRALGLAVYVPEGADAAVKEATRGTKKWAGVQQTKEAA